MFGTLGFTEVAVIFLIALVLFGPKKLPELGRTIGKAMTEFRRASNDLKATFDREMQTLERETQPVKAATQNIAREIRDQAYSYPPAAVWSQLEQQGIETATESTSVGASEVSGAESHGTTEPAPAATEVAAAVEEPATAAPEGAVPRGNPEPSPTQNS